MGYVVIDKEGRISPRGGDVTRSERRPLIAGLLAAAGAVVAAASEGWSVRSVERRGYREVARWRSPTGKGRFVAIDGYRSAADLLALGEALRQEFSGGAPSVPR